MSAFIILGLGEQHWRRNPYGLDWNKNTFGKTRGVFYANKRREGGERQKQTDSNRNHQLLKNM